MALSVNVIVGAALLSMPALALMNQPPLHFLQAHLGESLDEFKLQGRRGTDFSALCSDSAQGASALSQQEHVRNNLLEDTGNTVCVRLHTDDSQSVGGMTMEHIFYSFRSGRLASIAVTFDPALYHQMLLTLKKLYGRPSTQTDISLHNVEGTHWTSHEALWSSRRQGVILEEGSGSSPNKSSNMRAYPAYATIYSVESSPRSDINKHKQ